MKNQIASTINIDWLKQLPSAIALLDKDFTLISASANWFKKFELKEQSVKGVHFLEIFPNVSEDWQTKLQYALDGLKDIQIIDGIFSKNERDKKIIWYLNPWKDGYGNNIGVVLNAKEISQTNELQMELYRTKNLLKEKGKIAKIGSWEYTIDTKEVTISSVFKDIFTVQKDSEITMEDAISFYKKGNARDTIKRLIYNAINNGIPWDEDLELETKDDTNRWVNTIGRPKFKDGKCTRIIGTVQDITAKKSVKTVATVPKMNTDYQHFFRSSPAAMAIIEFSTGKVLDINEALMDVLEYNKDELVGKIVTSILSFTDRRNGVLGKHQIAGQGFFELTNINLPQKSGTAVTVTIQGNVIGSTAEDRKIIATVVDVSSDTKEVHNLKAQVLEANNSVDKLVNFAHMVSHNLKGHATNFSLLLNFLDNEPKESERKKLLSILKLGNENLTDTIKGLREIVAIRSNNKVEKQSLSVNDFIYKAEQGLSGLIKKENAKIVNEIDDDLRVSALPVYLESILVNCLSNAIKFKKEDKTPVIVFSATQIDDYTVLSIEDNGKGMDLEKHKDKLFGLYQTLGNSSESRGMGLYLTKYQVDLMKGKIEVQSNIGEGTTFKIFFKNMLKLVK